MSAFDLAATLDRAGVRLAALKSPRADKGRSRLDPVVEAALQALLARRDRPPMSTLARELRGRCKALGKTPPSRGTLYNAIERAPVPRYRPSQLPNAVREALYNLHSSEPTQARAPSDELEIPGDQVVFYCFNYGSPRALSYAAGMPWLCLERASRSRGFRKKSLSLLRAVMTRRGL